MKDIIFGLVGRDISYSFSKSFFTKKFKNLGLKNHYYLNFDLETISPIKNILKKKEIKGLNVTIPYKEEVLDFLSELDEHSQKIRAVNTIKLNEDGTTTGYNTDIYGFEHSIKPLLKAHHKKALILGTGGASKAVSFIFEKMEIEHKFVSRKNSKGNYHYDELNQNIILDFTLIVNCTPLGGISHKNLMPEIPFQYLNSKHLLYDLVYNPSETLFLKNGKKQSASVKNGLEMLKLQAEKSLEIWDL